MIRAYDANDNHKNKILILMHKSFFGGVGRASAEIRACGYLSGKASRTVLLPHIEGLISLWQSML